MTERAVEGERNLRLHLSSIDGHDVSIRRFAAARHENARAVRGARHTNEARAMPPNKVDARRFGADRANVTRASLTLASTRPSAGARCVDHTAELVDRAGKGTKTMCSAFSCFA